MCAISLLSFRSLKNPFGNGPDRKFKQTDLVGFDDRIDQPLQGPCACSWLPMKKPFGRTDNDKDKLSLFLSYAREDHAAVHVMYDRLRQAGFLPWMDTKDLRPGTRWEQAIFKAIKASDVFLVVLSDNSVSKRGVVQTEIRAALKIQEEKLEGDVYIIPVRLGHCSIPTALSEFQAADLHTDEGWAKLLDSLHLQYLVLRGAGLWAVDKGQPVPKKVTRKRQTYLTVSAQMPSLDGTLRPATFGINDRELAALAQRGLSTAITEFYALVPKTLSSPGCVFQGLRTIGEFDNTILVYASQPDMGVTWDANTSSVRSMPNTARLPFCVYLKLDVSSGKSRLPDATIARWNWVKEDTVLKGVPAGWQEPFGKLIWKEDR
jgi:hypothetical protein